MEASRIQQSPDTAVLEYLDRYADRFDLLHLEKPFMQVPDLHTAKGSFSSVERIVPEAERDYFSMRAGSGRISLSFAEAARWVIHTHAYDYSGIKSGAVGDARVKGGRGYPIGVGWAGMTVGTVIMGHTLRHTLLLNTTAETLASKPEDLPVWERSPETAEQRGGGNNKDGIVPAGASDLLTWQSRRIRLFHDGEKVTGVLVSNGDKILDRGANILDDPMTSYRCSKAQSAKKPGVNRPTPSQAASTVWTSLEPLIAMKSDEGSSDKNPVSQRPETLQQLASLRENEVAPTIADLRLISVVYGLQDAIILNSRSEFLEIPVTLLYEESATERRLVIDIAKQTKEAGIALGRYAEQLLCAAGWHPEEKDKKGFQNSCTDSFLSEIEPDFKRWLVHFPQEREKNEKYIKKYIKKWQEFVFERIFEKARRFLTGAGLKALSGYRNPDGSVLSAGSAYTILEKRISKILKITDNMKESEQ